MLPVTDTIAALLKDTVKKPQLILEIEGLPAFSSVPVQKYVQYNDPIVYGQQNVFYGTSLVDDASISSYVDLSKTTSQISQQLLIDKGGSSSTTSFDVAMIDKDGELSRLITSGLVVDDVLSRKARLYLALEGAGHPQDSLLFFTGILSGVSSGAGYVKFNLQSPEKLKTLDLFPKVSTELTANATNIATTLTVQSTDDFSLPADGGTLRTYLLLGEEIIEYTSKNSTQFLGCTRGQFGTIATAHTAGDNAESAYRLQGNLKDLSLKLMLSGLNEDYFANQPILSTNNYGIYSVPNAVFLATQIIDQRTGVTAGDIATIVGGANAGQHIVSEVVNTSIGSYLILASTLINEGSGIATLSLKSRYAVLPKFCGLEMTPDQVDIQEFEKKYTQFSANFFEYDFFLKEAVKGSEFIDTQILYPSGCYSLNRKTRSSLGLTIPPLAQTTIRKLDDSNVQKASNILLERNISNYFFNAVVVKYEKDQVDDRYLRGKITQSATSTNRIKVANRVMTLEADGVRQETTFDAKFSVIARRFLDRYSLAAEYFTVDVDFGSGFDIELGDVVIFDGRNLQVTDTKSLNGTRTFQPRLFEVQNRVLSIKGNPVRLLLVDTAFSLSARYGIVSPSSKIAAGSTTTNIKLKKSFGNEFKTSTEGSKYTNLIGLKFKIRSQDHTFSETRIVTAINPTDANAVLLDSPLSSPPSEDYIFEVANYSTSLDPEDQSLMKSMFVFRNNQVNVLAGISTTQLIVSVSDVADLAVGQPVRIHDDLYTNDFETTISNITGTTLTFASAAPFVAALNYKLNLLGWPDKGQPYRYI